MNTLIEEGWRFYTMV